MALTNRAYRFGLKLFGSPSKARSAGTSAFLVTYLLKTPATVWNESDNPADTPYGEPIQINGLHEAYSVRPVSCYLGGSNSRVLPEAGGCFGANAG